MTVLATTFAVAVVLYGLGSWIEYLATRRLDDRLDAAAYRLLAGWALASLIGVFAALAGWHLTIPALVVGVAGASGLFLLLAHVPSKWTPVRRQGHVPIKGAGAHSGSIGTECAPAGASLVGLLVAWALALPL